MKSSILGSFFSTPPNCTIPSRISWANSSPRGRRATPTIANFSGRRPFCSRWKRAGSNLRLVRSPDAPKMVMITGSGTRSPPRGTWERSSGLTFIWIVAMTILLGVLSSQFLVRSWLASQASGCELRTMNQLSVFFHRMSAKSVSHDGQHAVGEVVFLARANTPDERFGNHGGRHVEIDSFEYRPATLAGIGDVGLQTVQGGVVFEGVGGKVEQPAAHHAAVAPDLRDLREVEIELFLLLHDGEAFGEGLHHTVLNAIVHHLDEVAGTGRADMAPALVFAGSEGFEDGPEIFNRLLVAPNHHAVALFQAPYAAGRSHVDKLKALGGDFLVMSLRVLVVGVTAIDKDVAGIEQGLEPGNCFVNGFTLRHHDPDGL